MTGWFDSLRELAATHGEWAFWIAGFSLLTLLATLAAMPYFVAALPEDYFTRNVQSRDVRYYLNLRAITVLTIKNIIGVVLVAAGIAMLVLPGQGLLTLFVGLVLCDFPGKDRLTLKLVRLPAVLRALNTMRRARGKAEFRLE